RESKRSTPHHDVCAGNALHSGEIATMMLTTRSRCALAALGLTFAAGLAQATQIQEIPVTTSQPQARLDFDAGQAALDRGDGQRANLLFKSAVAQDPSFVYGWLNIANSSLSAE